MFSPRSHAVTRWWKCYRIVEACFTYSSPLLNRQQKTEDPRSLHSYRFNSRAAPSLFKQPPAAMRDVIQARYPRKYIGPNIRSPIHSVEAHVNVQAATTQSLSPERPHDSPIRAPIDATKVWLLAELSAGDLLFILTPLVMSYLPCMPHRNTVSQEVLLPSILRCHYRRYHTCDGLSCASKTIE